MTIEQPPGLQQELLKCSPAVRAWVLSVSAELHGLRKLYDGQAKEIERLREELAVEKSRPWQYTAGLPPVFGERRRVMAPHDTRCEKGWTYCTWLEKLDKQAEEIERLQGDVVSLQRDLDQAHTERNALLEKQEIDRIKAIEKRCPECGKRRDGLGVEAKKEDPFVAAVRFQARHKAAKSTDAVGGE